MAESSLVDDVSEPPSKRARTSSLQTLVTKTKELTGLKRQYEQVVEMANVYFAAIQDPAWQQWLARQAAQDELLTQLDTEMEQLQSLTRAELQAAEGNSIKDLHLKLVQERLLMDVVRADIAALTADMKLQKKYPKSASLTEMEVLQQYDDLQEWVTTVMADVEGRELVKTPLL